MTLLIVLVALLLEGCGGGGGGSSQVIAPVIAAVQRPDLLFMYFGVMGAQIKETAAHVNCLFTMMWNFQNWTPQGRVWIADQAVAQLEEARAAGITKFVLDVGPWIFNPQYKYEGTTALAPFIERLKTLGLWEHVVALYPVDEPDLVGITDEQMNKINNDLHAFGKVATIYTDRRKWPGLATCDIASFDKYGVDYRGDGVLEDLKRRLRPEQRYFFTVGGCDPWRDNVIPVLQAANTDPQCAGIVAFIYGDRGNDRGIRNNGMQPEYAEVGEKIKNAKA